MDNEIIDTTQEVVDNVVTTVYANSLETWAIAALIALGTMLILLIARRYVLERLASLIFGRRQNIKAATKRLVQQTKFTFILVVSIYAGSKVLSMPEGISTFVALVAGIAFIIQIGIWAHTLVEALITARREESLPEDPGSITTLNAISLIALTATLNYSKLQPARSRGVVAKHAALSRPRSRVRIPSGPLSVNPPSSS
jgi:hypothetical protein